MFAGTVVQEQTDHLNLVLLDSSSPGVGVSKLDFRISVRWSEPGRRKWGRFGGRRSTDCGAPCGSPARHRDHFDIQSDSQCLHDEFRWQARTRETEAAAGNRSLFQQYQICQVLRQGVAECRRNKKGATQGWGYTVWQAKDTVQNGGLFLQRGMTKC